MEAVARQMELNKWIQASLVASVFADPESPGLTREELYELGRRDGFGDGELRDAVSVLQDAHDGRYVPSSSTALFQLIDFNHPYEKDLRDPAAFVYIRDAFEVARRKYGQAEASFAFSVLVARAEADGINRTSAGAAIVSYILANQLEVKGDVLRFVGNYAHPAVMLKARSSSRGVYPASQVIGAVRDVVARRTDGRTRSTDPLRAFAEVFRDIGLPMHRIWWDQHVSELAQLEPQKTPTAVLVLAASLAEGALAFTVQKAQELTNGGAFGSRTFSDPGNKWFFEDLVKAARHDSARILEPKLAEACFVLNDQRRRIHAGRFLSEAATPASLDIKPHDAESAKVTAQRVVSAILEWLASKAGERLGA